MILPEAAPWLLLENDLNQQHEKFIALALAQGALARRQGNPPIGSLIVDRQGEIVGTGHNVVVSSGDPTGHAEIQALRDACRRMATVDLSGCTCYTVMEPCPMCCWALVEARIDLLVLGARHVGMKRFPPSERSDYGDYAVEKLLALTGRSLRVVTGILPHECEQNRRNWRPGGLPAK